MQLLTVLSGMTPWSLPEIEGRIERRRLEIGLSRAKLPSVVSRGWGERGPGLLVLEQIAGKLRWTLPELLGIPTPSSSALDRVLLVRSVQIIAKAFSRESFDDCPLADAEKTASYLIVAYKAMASLAKSNPALINSDASLETVAAVMRDNFETMFGSYAKHEDGEIPHADGKINSEV